MDTRLNIFTKTEQAEFIPVSLCHSQFIKYRHYCLSLARPNDMKIIIVQECHGLSQNLQTFYSKGEDKVIWDLHQINNNANESHSTFSSWSSPRYDSIQRKEIQRNTLKYFWSFWVFLNKQIKGKNKNEKNYLHGKAPNKQKKNKEIFLGFLFNITTKHAQKVNQLQLIFFVFSKVFQTHKKKARK